MPFDCKTLDEFLEGYGELLAQKARSMLDPLHVPGRDEHAVARLLRQPFEAQAHVIAAAVKELRREKACQLVAEMGSGKTLMALGVIQTHAETTAPATDPPPADVSHWVSVEYAKNHVHPCFNPTAGSKKRRLLSRDGETFCIDGGTSAGGCGRSRGFWGTWDGWRLVLKDEWSGEPRDTLTARGVEYVMAEPVRFGCRVAKVYRAVVVCPGQLVEKWAREIRSTVPDAKVTIIEDWKELLPLAAESRRFKAAVARKRRTNRAIARHRRLVAEGKEKEGVHEEWAAYQKYGTDGGGCTHDTAVAEARLRPEAPEYYVIGRDRLKLSSTWRPAYRRRAVAQRDNLGNVVGTKWAKGQADEQCSRCPKCGQVLTDKEGQILDQAYLDRARRSCRNCGEQLWQDVGKPRRYSPAKLIQKKLKGFFDYLVIDEAHEYKSGDSIQADAIGAVAAACKKVLALTGTLVGGYAWHVRTLLFRIGAARTMVGDGFGWKDEKAWNEKYGRIETKEVIRGGDDDRAARGHKMARGNESKKVSYVRPGIVPTMFKHLIGNSIFLGLDEVADNLPPFLEDVIEVGLDPEQQEAYTEVDEALAAAIRDMVRRGNKAMLGTMLNCLLAYPDYPYGWGTIGYWAKEETGERTFVPVVQPANLDPAVIRPKEMAVIQRVLAERLEGRQCWIYCQYTDKRDCIARLQGELERQGLRVKVMRSKVTPAEREEWINEHGSTADVIISHPDLVKTGLDFFNRRMGHNYVTIMFYQTGYNPFTLRQAARRAWRIGQRRECRVLYFYYKETMQERAMTLMGRKISAANALEGKFSAEGLAAMAGDDENMEMALAKSLADKIDEGRACRAWAKLTTSTAPEDRFKREAAPEVPVEDFLAQFADLGVTF